jgi:signal transduction histidine kinase
VVGEVAATMRALAHDEPPVIEWQDLPTVQGDPQQIVQLFQNLIGNAVKFVAPGVCPHVVVRAEPEGSAWRFAIEDNGIGIEPRHAERVFGMFQRLHTRDEFEGTGIGLAIARKVVELHGGDISAAPREQGGTRFTFTLPAARA